MAVKIELEKSEISDIVTGLNMYKQEREKTARSGRYMGRKITKDAANTCMKTAARLGKLVEFFESV